MKHKAVLVLLSISIIVLNIFLYLPLSYGWLNDVYNTPDHLPPFNLSNELFGEISSSICFIFLVISTFRFLYLIFKGKNFKQVFAPAILSICVLITTVSLNDKDYIKRGESIYPEGEFYYWQQHREYADEIKFIRWKKTIDSNDKTWELDSVSSHRITQE